MRCVNASFLGIIIVLLFALDPRGRAWMAGIKEAGKSLKFLDEPSNHEDACKTLTRVDRSHPAKNQMIKNKANSLKLLVLAITLVFRFVNTATIETG